MELNFKCLAGLKCLTSLNATKTGRRDGFRGRDGGTSNNAIPLKLLGAQLEGDYLWMAKITSKSEMLILGGSKSDISHFDSILTGSK